MMSTRAAFEKWALDEYDPVNFDRVSEGARRAGEYRDQVLEHDWQVWQAAQPEAPIFIVDDDGQPIVYDTLAVDLVAHSLTGDEGENDAVTVLQGLARYVQNVWPGKTALAVLLEYEESKEAAAAMKLSTETVAPIAWSVYNGKGETVAVFIKQQDAEEYARTAFANWEIRGTQALASISNMLRDFALAAAPKEAAAELPPLPKRDIRVDAFGDVIPYNLRRWVYGDFYSADQMRKRDQMWLARIAALKGA